MANFRLNLQCYEVCSVYSYVTLAPCLFFQRIENSVSQNLFNANFIVGLTRIPLVSLLVKFATSKFAPTKAYWARCLLAKSKTCTVRGASVKEQEGQLNILL